MGLYVHSNLLQPIRDWGKWRGWVPLSTNHTVRLTTTTRCRFNVSTVVGNTVTKTVSEDCYPPQKKKQKNNNNNNQQQQQTNKQKTSKKQQTNKQTNKQKPTKQQEKPLFNEKDYLNEWALILLPEYSLVSSRGGRHKTLSLNHNLSKEKRAEGDSNRRPSADQQIVPCFTGLTGSRKQTVHSGCLFEWWMNFSGSEGQFVVVGEQDRRGRIGWPNEQNLIIIIIIMI